MEWVTPSFPPRTQGQFNFLGLPSSRGIVGIRLRELLNIGETLFQSEGPVFYSYLLPPSQHGSGTFLLQTAAEWSEVVSEQFTYLKLSKSDAPGVIPRSSPRIQEFRVEETQHNSTLFTRLGRTTCGTTQILSQKFCSEYLQIHSAILWGSYADIKQTSFWKNGTHDSLTTVLLLSRLWRSTIYPRLKFPPPS